MKKEIHNAILLIAAAGRGRRMGGEMNKVYLPLAGRPVLAHTLQVFLEMNFFRQVVVVVAPREKDLFRKQVLVPFFPDEKRIVLLEGGSKRQHSVLNGLEYLHRNNPSGDFLICIHDGARPLVSRALVQNVLQEALLTGAAVAGVPLKDTVKEVDGNSIVLHTPPRENLRAIQTPQCFQFSLLWQAYCKAGKDKFLGSDDSSLVERTGIKVRVVTGEYENLKITTPDDLRTAETFLSPGKSPEAVSRAGFGYDVHSLREGLPLVLGGVKIPFTKGLEGYSDADVLLHAIMDALLGAAALGDIGHHFPPGDPRFKGISSLLLLQEVSHLLKEAGYAISNIDSVIAAQSPGLSPFIAEMRQNIASALNVEEGLVSVKATTTEKLGFVGQEKGIAAYAVAMLMTLY
ncbi:MAG: 2-C-methyl-D-erythritol 4-phosphate cytidylyltransferase [Firmicutes bacterium]|nr:2-C-methyl-D-erythritol 4-phosphate cytidylyltransferase [Bacillota bacterium]